MKRRYIVLLGTKLSEKKVPIEGHREWCGSVKHGDMPLFDVQVRFCETRAIYRVVVGTAWAEHARLRRACREALRNYAGQVRAYAAAARQDAEAALARLRKTENEHKEHLLILEKLTP